MSGLRILITGAGAPGIRGTLYALKKNPDGVDVSFVTTDIKDDVVGRHWSDRFYRVPETSHPDYLSTLADICKREAVDLVLPQTTREIMALSEGKGALERAGIRVVVSDPEAIAFANDKGRLLDTFARLELPFPRYYVARTAEELTASAGELGYPGVPVVVKPPVSNGMRGFRVLKDDAWDAERFLSEKPSGTEIPLSELLGILGRGKRWPELLVTEFLPGPEYSVDAFRGEHVEVAIPRLRRSIRSGISFQNDVELRPDMVSHTLTAARALGLRYAFGFQFKLDALGAAKVLECNPRVQGTMVASLFAGANVIWWSVLEALGRPVTRVPAIKPVSFYRYWGGIGLEGGKLLDDI